MDAHTCVLSAARVAMVNQAKGREAAFMGSLNTGNHHDITCLFLSVCCRGGAGGEEAPA